MPRRVFDGHQLERAAARQRAEDLRSPPEAKPCLMDVVRAFAEHIEARAQLGWTDPMIAALLTEAGYPISAGTLRSYRKRLRDAQGATVKRKGNDPPPAALVEPTQPQANTVASDAVPAAQQNTAPSHSPPPRTAARTDTFSIRGSSLPPSRA